MKQPTTERIDFPAIRSYDQLIEVEGALTVLANLAVHFECDDSTWDDVSQEYCLHEAERIVKAIQSKVHK